MYVSDSFTQVLKVDEGFEEADEDKDSDEEDERKAEKKKGKADGRGEEGAGECDLRALVTEKRQAEIAVFSVCAFACACK